MNDRFKKGATMSSEVQRKLTTILAADAEGYSRVMQADEVRALGSLVWPEQGFQADMRTMWMGSVGAIATAMT